VIAERLSVSVRTVDNHLARIYTKLGVAGRSELRDIPPDGRCRSLRMDEHGLLTTRPEFGRTLDAC
jgi:hypothetical protein